MVPMSEEQLALLSGSYPVEQNFRRAVFPRLGMYSQDIIEGKGKNMKVIHEAGEFYIEHQSEKKNKEGKNEWIKKEIGQITKGIIVFKRKQLKFYDPKTEAFTSSSVYDSDDEIIPLFANKAEVDRGTHKELKSREIYRGSNASGKEVSKLEDNRILYVLIDGDLLQLNLRGTSMYAFMKYERENIVPTLVTEFGSEAKEKGSTSWSQMTFAPVRKITAEEADDVIKRVKEMNEAIKFEKSFFASMDKQKSKADKDFDEIGTSKDDNDF